MKIKNFLTQLSFMITDLEVHRTIKGETRLMHKVLLRLFDNLSPQERKTNKKKINELKKRVLGIETIDKEVVFKIANLREEVDIMRAINEMKKNKKNGKELQ